MFSRSVLGPSRSRTSSYSIRISLRGKPAQQFSQLLQRREQQASPSRAPPDISKKHHDKQQRPTRGSIRPFTVLFLCIPLGYGVNWVLKKQNATDQPSPDGFVKYILASKEGVSSTCSIFSLISIRPEAAFKTTAPELARSITSVQIKQPQLQIARSYTLLPPVEGQDEDEIRFLIRREQKGEVSGYLHRLPLGAEIEVRGISKEYVLPEAVEKVVFLAGGTGITPAMQIANILKSENVDMHILWANRKREDCAGGTSDTQIDGSTGSWWSLSRLWSDNATIPSADPVHMPQKHQIVRELDEAKDRTSTSGHKLRIDYFVDEENILIQPRDVSRLLQNSAQGRKLLVVSGPEGFIKYWAGPKQWLNGREVQGPLAGALGGMNTTGWEILKL